VGGSGSKTGSNVAGPLRPSSQNREGAGVASQVSYTRTMEETHRMMESMEKIVLASTNTRMYIKQEINEFGKAVRELQRYSKMLGLTRNPDAIE